VARALRSLHLILALGLLASCQSSSAVPGERERRDIALKADSTTVEAQVPPNATLQALLRQQLPADMTASLIEAVHGVFNPRDLKADRTYSITRTLDGLFREFRYEIDADSFLRVVFRNPPDVSVAAFDVEVVPLPKEYQIEAVSAQISAETPSLIGAFAATGQTIQLPLQVAEIFGGEVDFNSELQRGDRVDVLFERAMRNGAFVGYGEVKAAVLDRGGRRVSAIRYTGADGRANWYDTQGRSLRRQFLKSPLPFTPRVTSRFSTNRFHPVLGISRPHLGVDYGAPYGTPVNAVASGVVEVAGWSGEAGRMVRIRHSGGYETAYLHLSSFAPGVRVGARVEQGQLVGRVGQTGTATGPHLDYRIIKNGVYVNPITELSRMPAGESLSDDQIPDFSRRRDELIGQLQTRLDGAEASAPVRSDVSGQ
jgi:murein DD-endopeptidase MepM/ murein hydrolase activator NlpD